MTCMNGRPAIILLAEDDPGDQELTRRALEEGHIRHKLPTVEDGEEVLDYVYRRGKHTNQATSPRPEVFLLDLHTPTVDGHEVREHIRASDHLRRLAVVVLTTSQQGEEVCCTDDLGANSARIKPDDQQRFGQMVQAHETSWLQTVRLPPTGRRSS